MTIPRGTASFVCVSKKAREGEKIGNSCLAKVHVLIAREIYPTIFIMYHLGYNYPEIIQLHPSPRGK